MFDNTLGLIIIFIWVKNIYFLEFLELYFKTYFIKFFSLKLFIKRVYYF
jgi:hypothetical protein